VDNWEGYSGEKNHDEIAVSTLQKSFRSTDHFAGLFGVDHGDHDHIAGPGDLSR
jgi:hypothetical protein